VDGLFSATWKITIRREAAVLEITPFHALGDRDAITAEGERLLRFVAADAIDHDIRFTPGQPVFEGQRSGIRNPRAMSAIQTDRFKRAPFRCARAKERSSLQESYSAVPCAVPVARRAITEFAASAGASGERLDAIRLATSEALSNVVQHAYPGRRGQIHVTARVAGGELWVLIGDDGCGLRAGPDSDGLGLGLALIAQMTDAFTVLERSSGGTELRLGFALRGGGSCPSQDRGSVSSATRAASPRFSTTR
jgi:serine/threonine-protein kinase RsbW